ncbi:MAG: ribose 5-phosphate isomerase B [Clostridia bacterium]
MSKKIFIGADHGGYQTKQELIPFLAELGYEIVDMGTHSEKSVDYPDIAKNVSIEVIKSEALGILICGTGIGMAIAANKVKGVRAASIRDAYSAKMLRRHNDGNILCLGGRVVGIEMQKELVKAFLNAEFDGGRHQRRVNKIINIEN